MLGKILLAAPIPSDEVRAGGQVAGGQTELDSRYYCMIRSLASCAQPDLSLYLHLKYRQITTTPTTDHRPDITASHHL